MVTAVTKRKTKVMIRMMGTVQTAGGAEAGRHILEKRHALLDMSANGT